MCVCVYVRVRVCVCVCVCSWVCASVCAIYHKRADSKCPLNGSNPAPPPWHSVTRLPREMCEKEREIQREMLKAKSANCSVAELCPGLADCDDIEHLSDVLYVVSIVFIYIVL